MENAVERGLDWVGLPVIATVARLLSPSATNPVRQLQAEGVAEARGAGSRRVVGWVGP